MSVLARVRNSGMREKNRKCICWIYGRRKCLDRLDELIQGDETAKLAYEEKKREFQSFDGYQKKNRKCNQKDKGNGRQRK